MWDRLAGVHGPPPPRADGRLVLGQQAAEAVLWLWASAHWGSWQSQAEEGCILSALSRTVCIGGMVYVRSDTDYREYKSFSFALDCLCE